MSDLVVIVYPSEEKAEEVRQRLFKLQKEYLITINDAVIAVKTEAGAVKLNQLVNATAVGSGLRKFLGTSDRRPLPESDFRRCAGGRIGGARWRAIRFWNQ